MPRAEGTGIFKVNTLGPEVDYSWACMAISWEVKFGLMGRGREGGEV